MDSNGKRPSAPFNELVIALYPGAVGYYLMHHSIDGTATDTWHEVLEDALHQGEWEFEVKSDEWAEINEPYWALEVNERPRGEVTPYFIGLAGAHLRG